MNPSAIFPQDEWNNPIFLNTKIISFKTMSYIENHAAENVSYLLVVKLFPLLVVLKVVR